MKGKVEMNLHEVLSQIEVAVKYSLGAKKVSPLHSLLA